MLNHIAIAIASDIVFGVSVSAQCADRCHEYIKYRFIDNEESIKKKVGKQMSKEPYSTKYFVTTTYVGT